MASDVITPYLGPASDGPPVVPCPPPREGGLCGCDEDDLAGPRDCYRGRCDC